MSKPFEITRVDGRSNQEVLIQLVKGAEPETLFTYEELAEALAKGTDRKWARPDVCGVVRASRKRLLDEHSRTLRNVKGKGYKMAHASEHMELSLERRRRGESHMELGLKLLTRVRENELDANMRIAFEGMRNLMVGMVNAISSHEQRLRHIERVIRDNRTGGQQEQTA